MNKTKTRSHSGSRRHGSPPRTLPTQPQEPTETSRSIMSKISTVYFHSIGYLTRYHKKLDKAGRPLSQEVIGTGILISPNLVITCCYIPTNSDVYNYTFTLGSLSTEDKAVKADHSKDYIEIQSPGVEIDIISWRTFIEVTGDKFDNTKPENNLACLRLKKPVDYQREYITYKALETTELDGLYVSMMGYWKMVSRPFAGEEENQASDKFVMIKHYTRIIETSINALKYGVENIKIQKPDQAVESQMKVDWQTGKGSPIFKIIGSKKYQIIGLDFEAGFSHETSALRITPKIVAWLDKLKLELGEKLNYKKYLNIALEKIKVSKSRDEAAAIGVNYLAEVLYHQTEDPVIVESAIETIVRAILDVNLYEDCLWLNRYLDCAIHLQQKFKSHSDINEKFRKFNKEICSKFLSEWRVCRKMMQVRDIFDKKFFEEITTKDKAEFLKTCFLEKLNQALEFLFWQENLNKAEKFTLETLTNLHQLISSKPIETLLSLIEGRLDKNSSGLAHTLILGEDGGLFLLFNASQQSSDKLEEILAEQNIYDDYYRESGVHGAVKCGLNLFYVKERQIKPGQLVYIKKSKSFKRLQSEKKINTLLAFSIKTSRECLKDYIGSVSSQNEIYSPQIHDISLIFTAKGEGDHIKGYVILEVLPQNNTRNLFIEKPINKNLPYLRDWNSYLRAYTLNLLQKSINLLNSNLVLSDLRPENIIYDIDARQIKFIDLGHSIKLDDVEWGILKEFMPSESEYCSKEIERDQNLSKPINFRKCIAFSCGRIIEDIVISKIQTVIKDVILAQDFLEEPEKEIITTLIPKRIKIDEYVFDRLNDLMVENGINLKEQNWDHIKKTVQKTLSGPEKQFESFQRVIEEELGISDSDFNLLKQLITNLTEEDAHFRESLEHAMEIVKIMGYEDTENFIKNQYIHNVKTRISEDRPSLHINNNIFNLEKWFIPLQVSKLNPKQYLNLASSDLSTQLDDFLATSKKKFFLLYGKSGSGKSSVLQYKFIQSVHAWNEGAPIPFYLNLAHEADINKLLERVDQELKTNIRLLVESKTSKISMTFFIDGFDEAFFPLKGEKREKAVRDFVKKLWALPNTFKMVIASRYDLICDQFWFLSESAAVEKPISNVKTRYILPLNYYGYDKFNNYVKKYLEYNQTRHILLEYTSKIEKYFLTDIMTTGFIFSMVMKTIMDFDDSLTTISYGDICLKFSERFAKDHKLEPSQREKINQALPSFEKVNEISQLLATEMHIKNCSRIEDWNTKYKIFDSLQVVPYNDEDPLKYQLVNRVFKMMPLFVETGASSNPRKENIKISFVHESLRNYFFIQRIIASKTASILEVKSIIDDDELISLFIDFIQSDNTNELRDLLDGLILSSKTNKSERAVIAASNAISILVAARCSFYKRDLSNITVLSANLRNGIFTESDLSGSNLSGSDLTNAKLKGANLNNANLTDVIIANHADIYFENKKFEQVAISPDGIHLACRDSENHNDKSILILDIATGRIVKQLITFPMSSIQFSSSGYLLTFRPNECIVWDSNFEKILFRIDRAEIPFIGPFVDASLCDIDGECRAVVCDNTSFVIFNLTRKEVRTSIKKYKNLKRALLSPKGRYLAIVHSLQVEVLDTESSETVCSVAFANTAEVEESEIKFADNEKTMAVMKKHKWMLIDFIQRAEVKFNIEYDENVSYTKFAFSNNGLFIARIVNDNSFALWDARTGRKLLHQRIFRKIETQQKLTDVIFSADNKQVAFIADEKCIKFWNIAETNLSQLRRGHNSPIESVCLSRDNKYIVTTSTNKLFTSFMIWDAKTGKLLNSFNEEEIAKQASFSCDNKYLITVTFSFICIRKDFAKKIINKIIVNTGKEISCHPSNSDLLAYVYTEFHKNNCLVVFDIAKSKAIKSLEHKSKIITISYTPCGKYLASCTEDGAFRLWDVQEAKVVRKYDFKITFINLTVGGKNERVSGALMSNYARLYNTNPLFSKELDQSFYILWKDGNEKEKPQVEACLQFSTDFNKTCLALEKICKVCDNVVEIAPFEVVRETGEFSALNFEVLANEISLCETPLDARGLSFEDAEVSEENYKKLRQGGMRTVPLVTPKKRILGEKNLHINPTRKGSTNSPPSPSDRIQSKEELVQLLEYLNTMISDTRKKMLSSDKFARSQYNEILRSLEQEQSQAQRKLDSYDDAFNTESDHFKRNRKSTIDELNMSGDENIDDEDYKSQVKPNEKMIKCLQLKTRNKSSMSPSKIQNMLRVVTGTQHSVSKTKDGFSIDFDDEQSSMRKSNKYTMFRSSGTKGNVSKSNPAPVYKVFRPNGIFEDFFVLGTTKECLMSQLEDEEMRNQPLPCKQLYKFDKSNDLDLSIYGNFLLPNGVNIEYTAADSAKIFKLLAESFDDSKSVKDKIIVIPVEAPVEVIMTDWDPYVEVINSHKKLYLITLQCFDFISVPKEDGTATLYKVNYVMGFITYYPIMPFYVPFLENLFEIISTKRKTKLKSFQTIYKEDFIEALSIFEQDITGLLDKVLKTFPSFDFEMHHEIRLNYLDNVLKINFDMPSAEESSYLDGVWGAPFVFNHFTYNDLMSILSALFLEKKLVFFSRDLTKISKLGTTLLSLSKPVLFCNKIALSLPKSLHALLEAPMSTIYGFTLGESFFWEEELITLYPDCLFIFIDERKIYADRQATQIKKIPKVPFYFDQNLYNLYRELNNSIDNMQIFTKSRLEKGKNHFGLNINSSPLNEEEKLACSKNIMLTIKSLIYKRMVGSLIKFNWVHATVDEGREFIQNYYAKKSPFHKAFIQTMMFTFCRQQIEDRIKDAVSIFHVKSR